MASLNRVLLLGNLTRDPQLRYLPNQTAVVDFGMAMNRKWKGANGEDKEETTFVDVSAFGKQAEVINQYCAKGRPLLVEGRLKFDTWEDKQGGGKRSKLSVIVDNFQLMGGKPEEGGGGSQQQGRQTAKPATTKPGKFPSGPPEAPFGDEQHFTEADVPF